MSSCPDQRPVRRLRSVGAGRILGALLFLSGPGWGDDASKPEVSPEVKAGLEQSETICRQIEAIRGLKFKKKVRMEVQSMRDFRAYIRKTIEKEYGKEEARAYVEALVKLGALERYADLNEIFGKIMESQAMAHYDPDQKVCYLLMTDVTPEMLDVVLSHETYHALQDQHFDLTGYTDPDNRSLRDNGDAVMARQCVVEGEATLAMMIWALGYKAGLGSPERAEAMASLATGAQAALDFETLMAMGEQGAANDPSLAGLAEPMKQMKDCPRFFMETLYMAYTQGALLVDHVKSKGGWKAVADLYKHPPQSTEQVLHPAKLTGRPDPPLEPRLRKPEKSVPRGWKLEGQDVMGELGIRVLFECWQKDGGGPQAANAAAAGWGGDRYWFFKHKKTGQDLLVWETLWDSPEDAREFALTYRLMLAQRFPSMKKAWKSAPDGGYSYQVWEVEPGRFLKLATKENLVGIVDTTDKAVVDVTWK